MQAQVVIASAARTPFGAFGGPLRAVTLPRLAAASATEAMRRAQVRPEEVDELVLGVNFPGRDRSVARQAQLHSGIPEDRISYTVDRACCSSLTAVSRGRQAILAGSSSVVIAGGAENLSLVPYFLPDVRWGKRMGDIQLTDQLVVACPYTGVARAVQASEEGKRFGVGRREQDAWAQRSQEAAAAAQESGRLAEELAPLPELDRDESLRPRSTLEKLAALPTVNGSETVTAGNAPGLSTGSSSTVLMLETTAAERGIRPLARIVATAMVSGPPQEIASIPAEAARKVMAAAGVRLGDVGLIEVNEAFAAVPLVTSIVMAEAAGEDVEAVRARMNVNGGAIAIGHPTGATGGRLLLTIAMELRRRGGGLGLVTMCGGIGEGEAFLLEVDPSWAAAA
jgi:acetyl-CoA C-acetyltransferase